MPGVMVHLKLLAVALSEIIEYFLTLKLAVVPVALKLFVADRK